MNSSVDVWYMWYMWTCGRVVYVLLLLSIQYLWMCGCILYLRTMGANNALLYPRRADVCEFMSIVKLFTMAAVAFSKELR